MKLYVTSYSSTVHMDSVMLTIVACFNKLRFKIHQRAGRKLFDY